MARLQQKTQAAVTTGSAKSSRHSLHDGFNAYIALSLGTGYSIHTFRSFRVVPCLMRRKASRPKRMIFGPGFP